MKWSKKRTPAQYGTIRTAPNADHAAEDREVERREIATPMESFPARRVELLQPSHWSVAM